MLILHASDDWGLSSREVTLTAPLPDSRLSAFLTGAPSRPGKRRLLFQGGCLWNRPTVPPEPGEMERGGRPTSFQGEVASDLRSCRAWSDIYDSAGTRRVVRWGERERCLMAERALRRHKTMITIKNKPFSPLPLLLLGEKTAACVKGRMMAHGMEVSGMELRSSLQLIRGPAPVFKN